MILCHHLHKRYGREITALHDINLEIKKGEFIFITGESGAGKTTLLKLILCQEFPSNGQILINGNNTSHLKASALPYLRRNIGSVFQDFKLLDSLTVFENVALVMEVLGHSPSRIKARALEVIKQVKLWHCANKFPAQLSGGEQQRIAIARAMANEPAIILADEPTGNLDQGNADEIMKLFNQANYRGCAIILATHDSHLMEKYPKRTITLKQGKIVADTRLKVGNYRKSLE